ncbi:HugZ family protein [Paenochrobactrum sp. BZR 588]|uniref:HugZ family pyridoxamine 5'-phosphate oxidase n=1 Tax=unclassified Paenochrobactrum TaxID=2639760 RepID=UPI00385252D3
MQNNPEQNKDVIRPTTPQAIQIAKTLIRTARFAALACISASTQRPNASRVALATDNDGTPLILVSALAPHTASLIANPYCSLLVGEPGKGDAMAHARMTLHCTAVQITRAHETYQHLRIRYLNHNPKGALYVDLGDFSFFRLQVDGASLNGGFGKAFNLTATDLICDADTSAAIAVDEAENLENLNSNYKDNIRAFANKYIKNNTSSTTWAISAIDSDGFNLRAQDSIERVWFEKNALDGSSAKTQIISLLHA